MMEWRMLTLYGIRKVDIRSGNQVDSIQVDYVSCLMVLYSDAPQHGGNGGSLSSFTLEADEYIYKVEGKTNNYIVDQLTFHVKNATGTTKKYGPYGKTGNNAFSKEGKNCCFSWRSWRPSGSNWIL